MAHDADRTPIERLGGFAIADLGTPRHPLRSTRARFIRRSLSLFLTGAAIGAPLGLGAAYLGHPPGHAGPPPESDSPPIAAAIASPSFGSEGTGPVCSDETALTPEQLIELDTSRVPAPSPPKMATPPRVAAPSRAEAAFAPVESAPSRSFLDPDAAIAAVHRADLAFPYCGPDAQGPVAVAVTFAPSGRAMRAVVEEGRPLGNESGSCVAMRLQDIVVPPFNGEPTTIRTRLMLR